MLDKAYEAKKFEDDIYKKWEESGAFKADANSDKEPFTISMPPPNATGVLHLGHTYSSVIFLHLTHANFFGSAINFLI